MIPPEKRKLSIDEQIRLMEQTGGYNIHSSEAQPPPIVSSPAKYDDRYVGLRNSDRPDPSAGTSPVTPSADPSGRPIVWADQGGISTGTTPGRSNIHGPTAFPAIIGLNRPSPGQQIGSNLPGSVIPQHAPTIVIPSANNPQQVPPEFQKRPGSPYGDVRLDALKDDNPSYPTLNPINGQQGGVGGIISGGTTPGQGNPYPPFGNIAPKTAGGASATPSLDDLRKQLAAQLERPVVIAPGLTQERSYTDPSHASAFKSPLIQPVPMEHQLAGTTHQSPVATPTSQVTRYPGDFNQPQPVSMKKPAASDSSGVQKVFPPGWADANVPKKRVSAPVVESTDGDK